MAPSSVIIEPITDEPEIIESPSTLAEKESSRHSPEGTVSNSKDSINEEDDMSESDVPRSRPCSPRGGPIITHHNSRGYSPLPRPHNFVTRLHEIPNLVSTKSLNAFIKLDDVCADTANNQMVYITNHSFAAADLDKVSWIFRIASQDTWVQKPNIISTKNGYRFDFSSTKETRGRGNYAYDNTYPQYIDDGYDRMGRPATTIVRLGHALRIFKRDEKKYGTENVKFVIVVQGKNNAGWYKLLVAHSRQAALVQVFYEILCGHSIQFLGALSVSVVMPVEVTSKKVKFQKVAGLKEIQECAEGVVGIVC